MGIQYPTINVILVNIQYSTISAITVSGCSTGSGMMFVELRGTRILTEGDSRFYT
jgi:hypothetical protein